MAEVWLKVALILFPLYFANGAAMLFGGGKPLDFGKKFRENELFGKGKTVKGVVFGLLAGFATVSAINYLFGAGAEKLVPGYFFFGFLLVLGGISGDLIGSFAKRRMGIERGKSVFPLDQLDFVLGGIAFGSALHWIGWIELLAVVLLTLFFHRFFNSLAFRLKLKSVPW